MSKKFQTMPKGEARPLGTKASSRASRRKRPAVAKPPIEKRSADDAETPLHQSAVEVESLQPPISASISAGATMTLTLKSLNKRGTQAIYTGARTAIRFSTSNFADKIAPRTLDVDGVLGPKAVKVKLTKEERAALPKPTLAERVRKAEARVEKMRAQLTAS